jgi:hypothetical protein
VRKSDLMEHESVTSARKGGIIWDGKSGDLVAQSGIVLN